MWLENQWIKIMEDGRLFLWENYLQIMSVVSNMIKKTIKMRISVDPNNCASILVNEHYDLE